MDDFSSVLFLFSDFRSLIFTHLFHMKEFWQPLEKAFKTNANPSNALAMKKYMKGQFAYYGLKRPERTALEKTFYAHMKLPPKEQMTPLVLRAWNYPEREWKYVAMTFMEKYKKHWEESDVELLEQLILSESWWDTVDIISIRMVGYFFLKYPHLIEPKTVSWVNSENIWLNRAAILFQLKYKEQTDWERLQSYILKHNTSKEFFSQKAIGWALREHSKKFPKRVRIFIKQNEHQLATLSKREGMKHINKNGGT